MNSESIEEAEVVQDMKLKYQRVIDATVKKLKIPFAVSGTDLSVLERFQTLWTVELDASLKKMGECSDPDEDDAPTPAIAAVDGVNVPQGDGNNENDSDEDDLQTIATSKYTPFDESCEGGGVLQLVGLDPRIDDVEDGMGNALGLEIPVGSGDDMTEDEDESFDTKNTIHCVIKKLTRSAGPNQSTWKMELHDGVVSVEGKDYFFKKASLEAKW